MLKVNKTGRDSVALGHSKENLMEKMTFEPRLETGGWCGPSGYLRGECSAVGIAVKAPRQQGAAVFKKQNSKEPAGSK